MDTQQEEIADKAGEDLKNQRFHMLEDIAHELSGELVFPTCFEVAFRLRQELRNPDLPVARITKLVGVEPLIAAKLMQLSASARYSPDGSPARNLQAAIDRLGVELVRTTALAIAINQMMRSKEMAIYREMTESLWKHSVKSAAAARILAQKRTRIDPDTALLAGLVHDLGAFYMLYRATQYPELRARPATVKYLIDQWHESIGVTLLNSLGLPEEIANAAIDHDQPRPTPDCLRTLTDIVYVANTLAGSHSEWLHQDVNGNAASMNEVCQQFSDLLPQIEADTQEMLSAFTA